MLSSWKNHFSKLADEMKALRRRGSRKGISREFLITPTPTKTKTQVNFNKLITTFFANGEINKYSKMVQFNMIVARCSNNGIGYKGDLPWSLRKEMQYFGRMTKEVKDPQKKNAVIMGRKTWDSLPEKLKPLPGRFNFVLSTQKLSLKGDAVLCSGFEDLVKKISAPEYANNIETAWIIGGSKIYEDAVKLNLCHRLYITNIMKEFECDTFLNIDVNSGFTEVSDERVPQGIQEENEIKYSYHVYEKLP